MRKVWKVGWPIFRKSLDVLFERNKIWDLIFRKV